MVRGRSTTRRRMKRQDTYSHDPVPSKHKNVQASPPSSFPDDDLSLWMPPKAKDRDGLEAEEVRPQVKQETLEKVGAVLHSMDLIVDGRGFLLPRKAKSKKDEHTVYNERYLHDNDGHDSSSSDESTSEDSSSQEEGICGRKKHDVMSFIPYGVLVQDDEGIQQHPKTPSKSSRHGVASFSTLNTEAMTLTPGSSRNSSLFLASSIGAFQSPPPSHRYIPTNFDFVNDLISPLPDEPITTRGFSHDERVLASPPHHTTTKKNQDSATTSNQRRAPYSSPVISKSQIVRSNRHGTRLSRSDSLRRQMLRSPQGRTIKRHSHGTVQQGDSAGMLSEDPTTKNVSPRRSATGRRKREQDQHHFQPPNVEELIRSTSSMMLHPTSICPPKATVASRSHKMELETSGRSQGTLSTEGATLTSSTDRDTAHSDRTMSKRQSGGGESTKASSILKEHLEFYSPVRKSVFRHPLQSPLRISPRVDADGFPMWSLDDDHGFPVWGLDDQHHLRRGSGSDDMMMDSPSLCSEAGAVILATRKVLVVKDRRGRTKRRDDDHKQPQSRKSSGGSIIRTPSEKTTKHCPS